MVNLKNLEILRTLQKKFQEMDKNKMNTAEFFTDCINDLEKEADNQNIEYSGKKLLKLKKELDNICIDIAYKRIKKITILEKEQEQEKRVLEILKEIFDIFQ